MRKFFARNVNRLLTAVACVLFLLGYLGNMARADEHGHEQHAGTGDPRHRECVGWQNFGARVLTLKHRSIPAQHVTAVLDELILVPDITAAKMKIIIGEGYVWPRGDLDFQAWVYVQCLKGFPPKETSWLDEGTFVRTASIGECIEKARIASQVARALDDGFELKAINFTFPNARTPDEVAAATAVIEEIKSAVFELYQKTEGQDRRVDRAAQAYLEQCAYNYGSSFRKTASSEALSNPTLRRQHCDTLLEDERIIRDLHVNRGEPFGQIRSRAGRSLPELGIERYNKIMRLIAEAEKAGDVDAWYKTKRAACEGSET